MAVRYILQDNDPALKKKSREVTAFDKRLHLLIDDMRQTLIEANGLGLAAPQVGVLRRVALIVDISVPSDSMEDQIVELINPTIINQNGEQSGNEGCLSIPGVYGIVSRPDEVQVQAQDRFGNSFTYSGNELVARAICHEIDHLDGILFKELAERFLTQEEIEEMRNESEVQD